jgi:outer membrane protein TolC
MKNFVLFAVLIAGCWSFAETPAVPPAKSVSLKEAVKSALEKTEIVPLGQARVNQSEARVSEVKSRFLPELSLGANYQEQDRREGLTSTILGNRQSYTRLSLSQSLYEGGRDRADLESLRAEREIQRQNLILANYSTFAAVARAFYSILSGEQDVANLKKTIEIASSRIGEIKRLTRIGRSRNVDLMAAQAQLAVLQADLSAAEGRLVTNWDEFILTTGLDRDVKLYERRELPDSPDALTVYLDYIEKRPDIAAMKAQIESTGKGIEAARAGHLPSVALNGNYYLTREGSQQGVDWDAGVTMSFPLYSGGEVKSQVREATEKNRETELLLAQTRRQAEIIVRTAYNNLVSALAQLRALKAALTSTEQNYKEQEKNYRFGQATNLDVIQALNSLQDTKRSYDRTRYTAFSAWAELKAATAQVSTSSTGAQTEGGS